MDRSSCSHTFLQLLVNLHIFSNKRNLRGEPCNQCMFNNNINVTMLSRFRYFEILRRRCYVTPTSYLELIKTFKSLLSKKRMQMLTLRNRYLVGLDKLEFASAQVTIMQQELTELQPELIKTSKETELLITEIAEETNEVAAKKKVNASKRAVPSYLQVHFSTSSQLGIST